MAFKNGLLKYASIVAIAGLISILVIFQERRANDTAQSDFVARTHAESASGVEHLSFSVRTIYDNIRTLASLPSVRTIDRHANNLSTEARTTFQQVYNNLASNVAVSEVYIVPIDFEPDRIDPITLKPEEPILMFDQLIVNAGAGISKEERLVDSSQVTEIPAVGPPEMEELEYRQLKDHAAWMTKNYGNINKTDGFRMPFISGPEIIVCDNTTFIKTGNDADRSGIMFSVPFYGLDGKIKGLITAIILTNALRDIVPQAHFALVNPGNKYVTMGETVKTMEASYNRLRQGAPDPNLIYSKVFPLSVMDSRSPWFVWTGFPNDVFLQSDVVRGNAMTRQISLLGIMFLTLAALACFHLARRNAAQSLKLNLELQEANLHAKQSEEEAHEAAAMFKSLNEDVTRLNLDLSDNIKALNEAQNEIVSRGKMAQLGSLIATVAHELRNPLGSVRTSAHLLKRKIGNTLPGALGPLSRVESGIIRCDNIITQLLDYSRSQKLEGELVVVDDWLEKFVSTEAEKLPSDLQVTCDFGLSDLNCKFDLQRMERVMINLLSNAAEAMVGKDGSVPYVSPTIEISSRKTTRGIEISVRDNGPGITPENLAKIREPLFTTKSFGTGLGIPAVEKILEMHGGGLDITSEFGRGACFTAWFPIVSQQYIAA